MRTHLYLPLLCCILLGLNACKKDIQPVIPADGAINKLNFYTVSDVLAQYKVGGVGLFVDSPVVKRSGIIPFFNLSSSPQKLEYPNLFGSATVFYNNFTAGTHRVQVNYMVPDAPNTTEGIVPGRMLADSSFSIAAGTETLVCLADRPLREEGKEPEFQLINVPANPSLKTDSNTVALLILHQSADLGRINASRAMPDGSLSKDKMPQDLAFGKYADFVLLDTREASNGFFGLRFYDAATGQEIINTAVPAKGNHGYILSVQGFKSKHQYQIPTGMKADGTVEYSLKTVAANLRGGLRQLW